MHSCRVFTRRSALAAFAALAGAACATAPAPQGEPPAAQETAQRAPAAPAAPAPPAPAVACGTAGLTLPSGFCATVFADSVGSARHLVVAPNGDVFVAIQRGRPNTWLANIRPGVLALRDTNGDGVADVRQRFGDTANTGIGLHDGYLYLDVGPAIVRYPVTAGSLTANGRAATIVSGIPVQGHRARNFVITADGSLLVNVGSQSNACQLLERQTESRGREPCTELETRAGIWRFDANQPGQRFSRAARYATGIRNATGLALEPMTGLLYGASHGRDQLHQNWPRLFTAEQSAELPAEELIQISEGDDFGWPYCYWDGNQRRRVLAPEYGGDGTTVGRCARYKGTVSSLPAHWAPNALAFYTGTSFPARYHGGAFIAMHGSWNRAPLRQEGYNVVFVPFANGTSTGAWEVFADGFGGSDPQPLTAPHRPTGVAVGPDGALYVSDDAGGRIWRITYGG